MRPTEQTQEIVAPNTRSAEQPSRARRVTRWSSALCALLLAGCAAAATGGSGGAETEIVGELQASAERWNAGDLAGFLAPYGDAGTTFVTAEGLLRGKAAIEARYRGNYWRSGRPAGTLSFGDLEVRFLGPDHALATGRYLLHDERGAQTGTGLFSLVYARTPQGWRIIHDHSS